jgi:hypothetical protein
VTSAKRRGGSMTGSSTADTVSSAPYPIEELKKRIPDLSEIELNLPSRKDVSKTAKEVGKTADDAIDRLLGRKRAPMWPWIAAGIGLVALSAVIAAWFAWFRRPTWETKAEPWSATTYESEQTTLATPTEPVLEDTPVTSAKRRGGSMTGSSTADTVSSAPYPIEEA